MVIPNTFTIHIKSRYMYVGLEVFHEALYYFVYMLKNLENIDSFHRHCTHRAKSSLSFNLMHMSIPQFYVFWCSKEPSHWGASFEYPQHVMGKLGLSFHFYLKV